MDAAVRVQAYRIAEHKDVRLPIMICQDVFITSHAVENIELLEDDIVKTFVGGYEPEHYLLKDNEPFAVGPYAVTNYVMEAKRAQMQGLRNAKQVTLDVTKEFEQIPDVPMDYLKNTVWKMQTMPWSSLDLPPEQEKIL